jgi:zinc transport system substrate-binding protein
MAKKLAFLILSVLILNSVLSGCKGGNANLQSKFTIVTSFYPIYISAINVARDIPSVDVINMTASQTGCLHDYQLKPQDLKTLQRANVFIINGAGMESFLDEVIKKQTRLNIIEASKGIELLKDHNGEDNAHVWVSVTNAITQVQNISDMLSRLNPENADKYKSNAAAYTQKLIELKSKMHLSLDTMINKDIITFHEAFPYFAKEFNLNIAAVIEREPGTAPTPTELKEIIEIVKKTNVKALFAEPQYEAKAAQTIANETGAKVYSLDPAVSGQAKKDAFDDYIHIMENNSKTLQKALNNH